MSFMMHTWLQSARTQTNLHPNHHANVQQMLHNHPPKLYEVTLSSGTMHLLAPDSESAAWMALELSHERNDELVNVKQADEW